MATLRTAAAFVSGRISSVLMGIVVVVGVAEEVAMTAV